MPPKGWLVLALDDDDFEPLLEPCNGNSDDRVLVKHARTINGIILALFPGSEGKK